MKNIVKALLVSVVSAASLFGFASPVLAYSPNLSAQYQGGGNNNVQITVSNASPFNRVTLNYRQSSSLWTTVENLGQTDSGGYFTQVISIPSDGSGSPVQLYVTVLGEQSQTVSVYPGNYGGCTYNCGYGGNLSFSQSNLNLSVGQSSTVTINNSYNTNFYISGNSNSSVASVSISGNQIYVYANQSGSTNITVCGNSSPCGTLYVSVGGGYSGSGSVWFSPSNPTLSSGQSMSVFINSNNADSSYYVSSNSNSGVVSASISGSTLNLYANQNGSSTITVCQNSYSNCGTLYVTVSGGYSGSLSLSQTSLSLSVGQSSTVTAYNSSGSLYISSNTNSSIASASMSGNQIYVYANQSGSTTITVCGYSSNCASIYVTVSGSNYGSNISLSQSSLNLNSGQSLSVSINGNGSYYISSNSNPSAATASISGNMVNVYGGNTSGNSIISICQSNPSGCVNLYVYTNSGYNYGSLTFNTTSLPNASVGQYYNYQLQVNGGTFPYTFTIVSGILPSGLYLTSGGLIYGTPAFSNTSNFSVRVTDNYGRSGQVNFTINGLGSVAGISAYQNGSLIKENGTVYMVYKNTKTGFASAAAFVGLGFNFGNVMNVSGSGLLDSGYIVRSSSAAHPWGSWVKSGQTVYFVHELGLIPVPDWNTFVNNGGLSSMVVGANSNDFRLPMLSSMVSSDSRLR